MNGSRVDLDRMRMSNIERIDRLVAFLAPVTVVTMDLKRKVIILNISAGVL